MKSLQILFISSICMLNTLEALSQAQFETSFYFEDAIGNRDTIVIGADTSAYNIVNTHLGESLLTQPWDSAFEVRVAREDNYHNHLWFGEQLYLYDKRITYLFDIPECGYSTSVIFLMFTENYPVTVTWDTNVWSFDNSPCPIDGSFFHHTDYVLEPGWWPVFNYACLGSRNSFEFGIMDNEPYSGIIDTVYGVGMEFIYGLQLYTGPLEDPVSPCYLEVSVNDLIKQEFIIYPNPTRGHVSIQSEELTPILYDIISVRDIQGVEVFRASKINCSTMDLSHLSSGLYLISLLNENNVLIAINKIVIDR